MGGGNNSEAPEKTIPEKWDRLQSAALTAVVSLALLLLTLPPALSGLWRGSRPVLLALDVSLIFGVVVRSLRAATWGGTVAGTLVSLALLLSSARDSATIDWSPLLALVSLFVLSFAATCFGRSHKEARGVAEARRGRQASQIVANLGAAALFASFGSKAGCVAALAEAAADTASSEIGQALGGRVRMITTLRPVPAGTDGGVTLFGTLAGVLSAIVVAAVGYSGAMNRLQVIVTCAACAGLIFDSLLGATVERRGWFGNDLVNFTSTVFAAGLALLLA